MAIQVVQGFRNIRHHKYKTFPGGNLGMQTADKFLIMRLPDSRVLKVIARCILLALLFVSLPWIGRVLRGSLNVGLDGEIGSDSINFDFLSLLFHDLKNEGILKFGDKALFVSDVTADVIYNSPILIDNQMDVISAKDFERQNAIRNESFDLIFTYNSFHSTSNFIHRTLKIGGIAAIQMSDDPSLAFDKPSNYKTVYIRRFSSRVVALRKTDNEEQNVAAQRRRLLCTEEAKKAALKNLEDVLLEPPRGKSKKSSKYLKRTRYLPDLMGDTLESYPRRVYIDVSLPGKKGGSSGTGWFSKNYPTRNLDFEIYKIETVTEEASGKEVRQGAEIGMSNWLSKNVKEEEYVVMKAEAEIVEEMVKSKAMRLVDELFLECRAKGNGGKSYGGRRAYWECLALYGRLRDEGVAVHQWWG
ncbi:Flowering time control protein like [Melia azedarach]|uniref:Flowering time control protein like n=1 Tax=Melia azedarach TaxID=155640 RepID=A0ACC1WQZ0_MELAZ|nr:Flowering time control protein like [Melia azedarach]